MGFVSFLLEGEPTMASLLADLATVVTQILTWVGTVCTTIVSTPLLLFTTGFLALGKQRTSAEYKSGKNGESPEMDNTVVNYNPIYAL